MRRAAFIYSEELEKFRYPAEHPFNTIRPKKTREIARSLGLLKGDNISEVAPIAAERMVLKKFHSVRYLHALKTAAGKHWDAEAFKMGLGTSDCPIFAGMYEYSALAAGGTLVGAELILAGKADVAFNPSGGFHHAKPEQASGFCYINDVALACIVLAEAKKRVLYLDVDVHHGDGVAYAFYDRSDVMTISFHEDPRVLFPGTGFVDEIGQGEGRGFCVNVPLPVGTFNEPYMKAFEAIALPLISVFKPDVIVLQAGADALASDPLAHLCLTNNVYVKVIEHLLSFGKPILMTGGGGYNIDNTVRAWVLCWGTLCGADADNLTSRAMMLGSTDAYDGLQDEEPVIGKQQQNTVIYAIEETIRTIKETVFPIHRL